MSVLSSLVRRAFDRDAARTDAALRALVPAGIDGEVDLHYGPGADERYDSWRSGQAGPLVLWVHGGGWISGDKAHVRSYAKILASHGFEVVLPNYTLAPAARYPEALRQVCTALEVALQGSDRPYVLAGDSAGAHLAAQVGALLTSPSYAAQLRMRPAVGAPAGMLLHCGPYVPSMLWRTRGAGGWFMRTVAGAYLGTSDAGASVLDEVDLVRHASAGFPPTWMSAGNADPMLDQSLALAARLEALGVPLTGVFYAPDHVPALGHEYQLDLGLADARAALESSVAFLRAVTG